MAEIDDQGGEDDRADGQRHRPKADSDELRGPSEDEAAHEEGFERGETRLPRQDAEDGAIEEDADGDGHALPHAHDDSFRAEFALSRQRCVPIRMDRGTAASGSR